MAAAGGGSVVACHTIDEWNSRLSAAAESKKLVVVDFMASWCGPCRVIAPVLADWARRYLDVIFLKVDIDELKDVATEFKVEAMPTFVLLKEGKEIDRLVGARKDDLLVKVTQHMTGAGNV